MGKFEAYQTDEEPLGEEPPPAGSAAYRKRILLICAAEDKDEYHALMNPIFQWRGWQSAVDVMTEIIGSLARNLPHRMVDAYGSIRLSQAAPLPDDEVILREAHESGRAMFPELPRRAALAAAISEGEKLREMIASLAPYWDQAATLLRPLAPQEFGPGRAVFTRWLTDHHRDQRVEASRLGASITHGYWRSLAMPRGDAWVDDLLDNRPLLSGSAVWKLAEPADASPVKKKRRRCAGCGKRHR